MTGPDWPELRVTDSDIDAAEDESTAPPAQPESGRFQPVRAGLDLRWCAGLATVALLAAAGALGFAEHRSRTVTITRYQSAPAHTIDAGGCPNGDNCSPLDGTYGGLASTIINDLPRGNNLFANEMLDTTSSAITRNVHILRLAGSGLPVAVLTQCRPDETVVPSRSAGLTGTGPGLAVTIRALSPGCSVAVLADVPPGVPVPAAAMQRLAADPLTGGP